MIEATGFETVSSLAEALEVNVSTIRRDLEHLAEAGLVRRTHGGAIPVPQDEDTEEFLHDSPNRAEKRAIGPAMAERILDGQSVFLDSGSTCLEVARALNARRVTVVTHDLLVGLEILKKPSLNLVFVGGELLPNRTHMWGPTAIDQLDHIRVNTAVFGANSVMEDGIYASSGYSSCSRRSARSRRPPTSSRTPPSSAATPCTRCSASTPSPRASPTPTSPPSRPPPTRSPSSGPR